MVMPLVNDLAKRPGWDAVQMKGLIGSRFEGSHTNRLQRQEEDHLLWPFQEHCEVGFYPHKMQKPGIRGDWQGEFMGTWLDAAILTYRNTNDSQLRNKIDQMVMAWIATQQPDGYLGTYDEADRWKSWDIWIQAHDLIGLLSYFHLTRAPLVLESAIRVADRVLQDFGPGKRGVRETGPHVGMASSAILEPIIWLYWETGNQAYLDFGKWLVDEDWEEENGPKIVSTILKGKGVAECGNSKGIEMLIDFAGLLELFRATAKEKYLKTIQLAWEDIVAHHLYITGSASTGEFFPKDFVLRNDGVYMIGETCVSMGWIYLNLSLARLTGDAKYFDMVEQTLYNHLFGAQSPDGRNWVYYMGLRDSKRFRWHTDPECCPSRGVRAIAQLPTHAITLTNEGMAVNLYEDVIAQVQLPDQAVVGVSMKSAYPYNGAVRIELSTEGSHAFQLRLRLPGWCKSFSLAVNGQKVHDPLLEKGYICLVRTWQDADKIDLILEMPVQIVIDTLGNVNQAALTRGPIVYALDQAHLESPLLLDDICLVISKKDVAQDILVIPAENNSTHLIAQRAVPDKRNTNELWREKERYKVLTSARVEINKAPVRLVPFMNAGNKDPLNYREGIQPNSEPVTHLTYKVWLPYLIM